MKVFRSVDDICSKLSETTLISSIRFIGIDGKDGSGKTTLAQQLKETISCKLISLDDYVDEKKGSYVSNLYIEEIHKEIDKKQPTVIEGGCLLYAAELIGIKFDMLVYIKRIVPPEIWIDEDECNPKNPVEKFIENKERELQDFVHFEKRLDEKNLNTTAKSVELPKLEKEMIRYHAKYRPVERADYVLKRIVYSNH